MALLSPEERRQMAKNLRSRVLNVLPAATYQMDRFLALVDIMVDETSQSASMECGPQPILHLNQQFVEKFCRRDEHLMMLLMHEIYHLILGHTRLFPRVTMAHNLVFDAVINALLCQQFRDPLYTGFFTSINSLSRFPGRLLRPPKGWPERSEIHPKASENERKVMQLLYGKNTGTVTYHEIMKLLEEDLSGSMGEGATLLGDHSGENGDSQGDAAAIKDPLMTGVLRKTTENWPKESNPGVGRGEGDQLLDWLAPAARPPRALFLKALADLLRRASVLPADPRTPYAWKRQPTSQGSQTALYDFHDRTIESRSELYGETPLLFTTQIPITRPRWTPRDITHIYLDVSGSMSDELPWLVAALEPLNRRGLCRIYAFSTEVDPVENGNGLRHKIKNTFGTNINCVLKHLVQFPLSRTPGKVVILTDGYTGYPKPDLIEEAEKRRIEFFAGIVGKSPSSELEGFVKVIERLPAYQ